jgi:hypothetical protein
MSLRLPDNPVRISVTELKRMDSEPDGTYLAQSKMDGWRRVAIHLPAGWQYISKHSCGPGAKEMPLDLRQEFESYNWPDGTGIDCEWLGPRETGQTHELWLFDLCYLAGTWIGDLSFEARYNMLADMVTSRFRYPFSDSDRSHVHLTPVYRNPGLVDVFMEQLSVEHSEGLVIRRADSTLVGAHNRFADNPLWWKCKFTRKANHVH